LKKRPITKHRIGRTSCLIENGQSLIEMPMVLTKQDYRERLLDEFAIPSLLNSS